MPRAMAKTAARSSAAEPRPEPAPKPERSSRRPFEADRAFHAMLARLTGGISPVALSLAYIDWASHLAAAPQRQMEIAQEALRSAANFFETALHYSSPGQGPWSLIKPQPQDRRFAKPEWETPPFNLLAQAFLLREQWWHNATTGRARRGAAERGDRRVLGAAGARYAGAVQFRRHQSRSAAEGVPERRREFRLRLAELVQRPDAAAVARQAGRAIRISSSARPSRPRAARSCSATN